MPLVDTTWYMSSVAYAAVTARPQNTSVAAGVVRRQFTAPAVNSERVFVCTIAGTTANVTDATWVLTRGAATTDGTATWRECTGQPAVNGDLTNTATWAQVKAATPAVVGQIIKRSNNASYQICTTAGAMSASEPTFSDTAGVTTTDTTAVWTSLGPVGNFPAWGAPHARLANAYASTWGAGGHRFFVKNDHAETQSTANTLTSPATAAVAPTYVVCVNSTSLPPVAADYTTGATIYTSGNSNITLRASANNAGTCYYQGIIFNAGGAGTIANINFDGASINYVCSNCAFILSGSNTSSQLTMGSTSAAPCRVLWDNCTYQVSATAHAMILQNVNFEWRNTPSAIAGATVPANLFTVIGTVGPNVVCRGVDFSALAGTLLQTPNNAAPIVLEDCKLNASVTKVGSASATGYASTPVITVRCDS